MIECKSEIITAFSSSVITIILIVFVLGKNKIKWVSWELLKMFSGEPSFFSKKRVDSGIAFFFAFWMTIFYLKNRIDDMDIWSFGYVLTVWLFIAGYTLDKIQREKKFTNGSGCENSAKNENDKL